MYISGAETVTQRSQLPAVPDQIRDTAPDTVLDEKGESMGDLENGGIWVKHSRKSPQREVVRSSAGASVVPPPLFWGSFV